MGKRSKFELRPEGQYFTPREALAPLFPYLTKNVQFIEPCAGDGRLVRWLEDSGLRCVLACDIDPQLPASDLDLTATVRETEPMNQRRDALTITQREVGNALFAITNPPWPEPGQMGKPTLPIIQHMLKLGLVTWALLPADMLFTAYAAPILRRHCQRVVTIGRVKWIPGSEFTGMANCAWFKFTPKVTGTDGPLLHPKR